MDEKPTFKRIKSTAQPSEPRREGLVDAEIMRYLKSLGSRLIVFKKGEDGWPDRVVCYKGYFIGIEVKSERLDHEATRRQVQRIREIRDAGGIAIVTNAVADVKVIVDRIDALHSSAKQTIARVLPGQIALPYTDQERIDELCDGGFIDVADVDARNTKRRQDVDPEKSRLWP